jgi:streptogramin lyase
VRREWRFGQKKPVDVHIFTSELEGAVISNLESKEKAAEEMAEELSKQTRDAVSSAIGGSSRTSNAYDPRVKMIVPSWVKEEQ